MTRDQWMDAVFASDDLTQDVKRRAVRLRYFLPDDVGTPDISNRGVNRLARQWSPRPQPAPA